MSTRQNRPDDDRLARARQARQVISGADIRQPSTPSGVYVSSNTLFTQSQRTYLIALGILLVFGVLLWLIFSMSVASVIFFLLSLTLIAGWLVFQPASGARAVDWGELETELVLPGITRQVVHGERQTMVRYVYAPGSIFPVHAHPEEQVTVVVSGRIAFEIDGSRVELSAGQVAIIPPNAPHGAEVIGNDTVESFNALSPRRYANPLTSQSVVAIMRKLD